MPKGIYLHKKTRLYPKDKLEELYLQGKLSGREIGKLLNIPASSIFNLLQDSEIPLRSKSDAEKLSYVKNPCRIEESRETAIRTLTGKTQTPEHISNRVQGRRGYRHSLQTKNKIGQSNKGKKWDQERRNRDIPIVMNNRRKRPTGIEVQLQNIIQKHNLPYKYTGDGFTWIAGRCPDFLNVNGQKTVIELFGRWWHDPSLNPKVKLQHTEKATIAHYAKYGFKCVIIWEEELFNESGILVKL